MAITSFHKEQIVDILRLSGTATAIYTSADIVIEFANDAMLKFWDRDESVIGERMIDAFPEFGEQGFVQLLQRVWTTGETFSAKDRLARLMVNGSVSEYYFDFEYRAIPGENGGIRCILHTATDVTERNQQSVQVSRLNRDLEESDYRFRRLMQQSPVAMGVLIGPGLEVAMANEALLKLLGRDDRILGMKFREAMPELEGLPFFGWLANVVETGVPHHSQETEARIRTGGQLATGYYNHTYEPIFENGLPAGVMIVAQPVTDQVLARRELELAEESLRLATDSAGIGTWNIDLDAGYVDASLRFYEILGVEPDVRFIYNDMLQKVHPDYLDRVKKALSEAIDKGQKLEVEFPFMRTNDGHLRWMRMMGKMNVDHDGASNHLTGVSLDITEQKLDEIRKNDFIAMVSHELKTPLTSLKGYIQLLLEKEDLRLDEFTRFALNKANSQSMKMTNLINGFLNVSRLDGARISLNTSKFVLSELIESVINEFRIFSGSTNEFILKMDRFSVMADQEKIGQVVNNLVSNAVKYGGRDKPVLISCTHRQDKAHISVTDQGTGIRPQNIPRLFERFYRVENKENQTISGFGIGLYICYEIVTRHHGEIWVESEWQQGSTFSFTIPLMT